jgi:hypothetical protein
MLAISAALSFFSWACLPELRFSLFSENIEINPAIELKYH